MAGRPRRAELLLMAANCALAAAQPQAALDRAQAAYRLFRSQHSAWGQAHAGAGAGPGPVRGRPGVRPTAARGEPGGRAGWRALGSGEATQAHLLAGRVALELGRRADADRHLAAAARSRRRGPAMSRASGWLGEALRAERRGPAAPHAGRLPPRASSSSTSTGSPWARRSCGRRPPRTAPSWPRWRSAMPRTRTGRGSCWPGPSAGGPPR